MIGPEPPARDMDARISNPESVGCMIEETGSPLSETGSMKGEAGNAGRTHVAGLAGQLDGRDLGRILDIFESKLASVQ